MPRIPREGGPNIYSITILLALALDLNTVQALGTELLCLELRKQESLICQPSGRYQSLCYLAKGKPAARFFFFFVFRRVLLLLQPKRCIVMLAKTFSKASLSCMAILKGSASAGTTAPVRHKRPSALKRERL
eukprot:4132832-Amphidinium_carterae.1